MGHTDSTCPWHPGASTQAGGICLSLNAASAVGRTHHGGVAAADQLADLVENALAVDGLIKRAPFHNHRDRQQDLLPDVLLEAAKHKNRGETLHT